MPSCHRHSSVIQKCNFGSIAQAAKVRLNKGSLFQKNLRTSYLLSKQTNCSALNAFFLEAFCDISHRLGGITPFGVFSDAFPGLKMWVTFACATAKILTHFIISIAVLENVPPEAGLQKRATFPH
jgi:hypothetical protein